MCRAPSIRILEVDRYRSLQGYVTGTKHGVKSNVSPELRYFATSLSKGLGRLAPKDRHKGFCTATNAYKALLDSQLQVISTSNISNPLSPPEITTMKFLSILFVGVFAAIAAASPLEERECVESML